MPVFPTACPAANCSLRANPSILGEAAHLRTTSGSLLDYPDQHQFAANALGFKRQLASIGRMKERLAYE